MSFKNSKGDYMYYFVYKPDTNIAQCLIDDLSIVVIICDIHEMDLMTIKIMLY